MRVLQFVLLGGLGVVAWRLTFVQQVYGHRLTQAADEVQQSTAVLLAPRGSILDASGQPLAYDVPAYYLDVNTRTFSNVQKLANLLAGPLGVSAGQLLPTLQKLANSESPWYQWPHPILEQTKAKIESAMQQAKPNDNIGAYVTFTPTEQRFYPDGTMAANAIGYINAQGVGQTGIEAEYNKVLSGSNGSYTYTKEGDGEPIETSIKVTKPASPGDNVELNIDRTIQGFVEDEMNSIVNQYHPEHATIIVMNPKTGAILAMASRPTFNPNTYWDASSEALFTNWAVNSSFEPGSTFKIITLAAALATNTVSLNDIVPSGHLNVNGATINDWNDGVGWSLEGPDKITVAQALQKSSNVGFATIALKLGWTNLLHYMQNFGFLAPTGVDLPGESTSDIFPPDDRGQVQLATSGFGQGISVTPLQQMAALTAILDGGNVMKPELAKAIIDPDTGKVVKQIQPQVTHANVIPPSVAEAVKNTMIADVTKGGEGIDQAAYLPGYEVGGKTGTAQIVNPATKQYYSDRFAVSFLGFAPGWNPQVEVYVDVYYPKSPEANTWGSTISAPPATQILKECMNYYHIAPEGGSTTTTSTKPAKVTQYVQTPSLVGETTANAAQTLNKMGLHADVVGQGTVSKQWPAAGVSVPKGSTVYLLPAAGSSKGLIMPDLTGTSMREAGDILAAAGMDMVPQGSGFAVSQSIPPGTAITPGERVTVQFSTP
ncbi:penicillin-binding transpeptidase domain-containing protein [Alicyclobacillus cycloheptanicus]|nr:penicillin-binding transpeptidase domain-containing protein [Alicyclobacillus cycloheptanicus]